MGKRNEEVGLFEIGDVARRLLRARGREGVSMRKIAKEFGCSPSVLYANVPGVKEVRSHVVHKIANEVRRALELEGSTSYPDLRIEWQAAAYRRYWLHEPESLAFVFALDLVDYNRLRLLGTMWPDLVATFGEEEAAAWWTQLNGILVTEAIQAIPVEWAERFYARTVKAMRQQVRRAPPRALARTG